MEKEMKMKTELLEKKDKVERIEIKGKLEKFHPIERLVEKESEMKLCSDSDGLLKPNLSPKRRRSQVQYILINF